jgi:hypothetical protein
MSLEQLMADAAAGQSRLAGQMAMNETARLETQRTLESLQRTLQEKEVCRPRKSCCPCLNYCGFFLFFFVSPPPSKGDDGECKE